MTESILVSMPLFKIPPEAARRAIVSMLEQTHRDLKLLVVNDGDDVSVWEPFSDITDPRMLRLDLPVNRGRYFVDAVTLAASVGVFDWWTPHDADDWSEPDRFQRMVAKGVKENAEVVFCGWAWDRLNGTTAARVPTPLRAQSSYLRHVAHHTALFRPAPLLAVGGPHPEWRIAYDTLMVSIAATRLEWTSVDAPLYHHVARPGSLSLAPETGMKSKERILLHRKRQAIWDKLRRGADPAVLLAPSAGARAEVRYWADQVRGLW